MVSEKTFSQAGQSSGKFFTPVAQGVLQRKCSCGTHSMAGGGCESCGKKNHSLQRKTQHSGLSTQQSDAVPPIVHEVLRSPGHTLDAPTRAFFEPRFGHDFSRVRVHTGGQAGESARAVSALAYTVGQDIVFASGAYAPHTTLGRQLLAHELTHTVQQDQAHSSSAHLHMGKKDTVHEQAASAAESQVVGDSRLPVGQMSHAGISSGILSSSVLQRFSESSSSGSSGGGGPAPSPGTGSSCKIDVRATHIGGILSGAPIWHLFIVYTDSTGTEFYYRGGPGGSCPGVDAGSYGTIITNNGPYVSGTVDWDPSAPSVTVMRGPAACGKDSCFASELRRIDGTCTPYAPTGPNSNTVASTLLSNCSVPRNKPVMIAPGWGHPNI
ncbi:MAG: DUF4157 domain-containing protein [Nitrospira sp.]|nr:DUF4157 domain-containing protein [Nitrospira sp.]